MGAAVAGVGDLSSVARYDPATNAWEAVASLSTARSWPTAVVLDGALYAMGGYVGEGILRLCQRLLRFRNRRLRRRILVCGRPRAGGGDSSVEPSRRCVVSRPVPFLGPADTVE
jgi:hypothetical protein